MGFWKSMVSDLWHSLGGKEETHVVFQDTNLESLQCIVGILRVADILETLGTIGTCDIFQNLNAPGMIVHVARYVVN